VRVERASEASGELVEAMERLLPQLSSHRRPPSLVELVELTAAPGTTLFVARDGGGTIVGMLTLVLYRVPTGVRGWIHDVVVDESARGQGAGESLTQEALRLAEHAGAISVELTTRSARETANRLYQRLGFTRRETNVYVWRPR
jgi:ribosomal protein S18 acetylase RimI-like enzyme